MGKRHWALALLLLLLATACSSSGKAAQPRAGADPTTGSAGLVGHGKAKQKVPADIAFVIVEPGTSDGFGSFDLSGASQELTPDQRAEVRSRVHELGVAPSSVHFDAQSLSVGSDFPTTVRVEVSVSKLPDLASKIANAITDVIENPTTSGLRFAVSDCSAALSTARPAAMADARKQAESLARAADVTLGELRTVKEGSGDSIEAAYLSALGGGDPCGRSSVSGSSVLSGYGGNALLPLDAEPEVELTFSVAATYALTASAGRTLTATGIGEVEAKADRADIVVSSSIDGESISLGGGPFSRPEKLTADDRDRIVSGVRAFGVPEGDIEVETQAGDVFSYARIHLDISRFRASGTKIVDAVKRVVGEEAQAGVFFTASRCEELVARAREKAVADADKRIDRLASAAKVRVGKIVGLDEPSGFTIGPQIDSCPPDFEALESSGALAGLSVSLGSGLGGLSLQQLDAEAKVMERVSVSETRAITG